MKICKTENFFFFFGFRFVNWVVLKRRYPCTSIPIGTSPLKMTPIFIRKCSFLTFPYFSWWKITCICWFLAKALKWCPGVVGTPCILCSQTHSLLCTVSWKSLHVLFSRIVTGAISFTMCRQCIILARMTHPLWLRAIKASRLRNPHTTGRVLLSLPLHNYLHFQWSF